VESHN